MQQPILVPLDGSDLAEQALPYAEALAESGRQLILLEVGQDSDDDLRALERHADSGARLETAQGDPTEQILQVAQDLGVGLIVMTTNGRGAVGCWAFGSVADQVTRRSPVPVFVVRPREEDGSDVSPVIRRLVVPLDGSALAEEALPTAVSLAKRLNVPVQRLRNRDLVATSEVRVGSPATELLAVVQEGDLVVLTTRERGGIERWFLGSVAEELVRHAAGPVLLVRATTAAQPLQRPRSTFAAR